jgi:hypothetical protein
MEKDTLLMILEEIEKTCIKESILRDIPIRTEKELFLRCLSKMKWIRILKRCYEF